MQKKDICKLNGWSEKAILIILSMVSILAGFSTAVYSDTAKTATITITFEDGAKSGNLPIADNYSHYLPVGVNFRNAVWITSAQTLSQPPDSFFRGNAGFGVQNGVQASDSWAFPGISSPIEVVFDQEVNYVSVEVFDVGSNGARLRAFGSNGLQIGRDQTAAGKELGTGNGPFTLSVGESGIRNIKLDQYLYNASVNDGIGWDNLTFKYEENLPVCAPEPSSILLFAVTIPIMGFMLYRQQVKRKSRKVKRNI